MRCTALGVGATLGVALLACTAPWAGRSGSPWDEAMTPARHAVASGRLRQLMTELEQLSLERMPQALDLQALRAQQRAEIASTARRLAEAARRIPDALGVSDLDETEQREFRRLSDVLVLRAQTLAIEAEDISRGGLHAELEAIDNTCARCHSRFRIPREPDA